MNNQAAQTMPLPPYLPEWSRMDNLGGVVPSEVRQALIAMYQQGYAAALSQTAGAPEGYVLVPVELPDMGDAPNFTAGLYSRRNWEAAISDLRNLAAAPAASGGEEVSRTLPIDVRGQWYEVPIPVHLHVVSLREMLNNPATFFHDDTALANWLDSLHATNDDGASTDEKWEPAQRAAAFLRGELPPQAPQPPAGASVSERARGYHQHDAIEFAVRDLGYSPAEAARITAAIEQALTQQRGSEPLGYTALFNAIASATWPATEGVAINVSVAKFHESIGGNVYPTPQPGAEALRELVRRILNWQPLTSINKADRLYQILMDAGLPFESVTDELESLLGRGG